MKINLGCGRDYRDGWVNLDLPIHDVDVAHDLDEYPYPFRNNSIDYIDAKSVVEHLKDTQSFIDEVYRILKPGGKIRIIVPNFHSHFAFEDIDHKKYFTPFTFHAFDHNFQTMSVCNRKEKAKFRIIRNKLIFLSVISPFKGKIAGLIFNSCRQMKTLYNQTFLHYLIPTSRTEFILKKV